MRHRGDVTFTRSPANSGLFASRRKTLQTGDRVVADAVAFEPVSIPKFPANMEKNREFYRIAVSVQRRRYRASEANSRFVEAGHHQKRTNVPIALTNVRFWGNSGHHPEALCSENLIQR
jgi:hypothetical protein